MKYSIALTLFVLVPGQVNRNFKLVLNEMGPGRTSQAWYFHTTDQSIFVLNWMVEFIGQWLKGSTSSHVNSSVHLSVNLHQHF